LEVFQNGVDQDDSPRILVIVASGYTDDMPKSPWYQLSLRSLLLWILFVVVVCSLDVWTHWLVSAVIVTGGVVGGIFAGTRLGVAQGAVSGSICSIIAVSVCAVIIGMQPSEGKCIIVAIIGSLLGGVLGGYSAKYHSDG